MKILFSSTAPSCPCMNPLCAASGARGLRASFVLANVQESASFYEIVTSQNPPDRAPRRKPANLMAPSARLPREAGVSFETAVITGDPAHAMLELIELHGCDMVVMGARALGPIRRMLEGGSTSRRLLDDAPVPVLLVKPPPQPQQD